jgi:hypothetical protein
VSFEPADRLRLELSGGLRAEQDPQATPTHVVISWIGADIDVTLARAWYLLLSATRQRGGVDDQLYGA